MNQTTIAIHTSRQSCYKAGKSANVHVSSESVPAECAKVCLAYTHERSSNENHDFCFHSSSGSEALGQQPGLLMHCI